MGRERGKTNENRETSGQGVAEKEENLGEKLRRVVFVAKRGGPSTPTAPTWRPWPSPEAQAHDSIIKENSHLSARKLAAALWEFHHYLPFPKMDRGINFNGVSCDFKTRGHRPQQLHKNKALDLSQFLADPSPSSPEQPESAISLRRHIAQSLIQHHRSIERSNRALQPVSPASYGRSLEMAPYNPAVTPTSSIEFKGRVGESRYNLKTSTELLKVLNRIWSLEEQHASNVALIKALKTELGHACVRIKELLHNQQVDRHAIDELVKQIAEDKLVMKSKEQDHIRAAVRDELEDERKLRKQPESLHRKLAQELLEVKSSLSNALKRLEREKKSMALLEELCDEFALGIKSYEQKVHALKQKSDKAWAGKADCDCLILHISESWIDERMQMKLEEAHRAFAGQQSIVDKLGFEIETYLQAKRAASSKRNDNVLPRDRQNSLESVPLNKAVSAPQVVGDEEDSAGSHSNCFELNKQSNGDMKLQGDESVDGNVDETTKHDQIKQNIVSLERQRSWNPSSLQVKFEERMAWAMLSNGNKKPEMVETEPIESSMANKSENTGATDGSHERKNEHDEIHGSNSNHKIDNLIRNHKLLSEGSRQSMRPKNDSGEASCGYPARPENDSCEARRNQASPVRQWMSKLTAPDIDISESSTKLPAVLKDNTLKTELLKARSKGHGLRVKVFKGSS